MRHETHDPSANPMMRYIFRAMMVLTGIGIACIAVLSLCAERIIGVQDTHGQTGLLWSLASDPTAGAGVAAPQWQLLVRTDVPSVYYKSGIAATAWTKVGNGAAGGGGTVTSVACGTNLTCAPSPIVGAGTVATVAAPTFAGTATAANFTTAGNVNAATGIVTSAQDVTALLFATVGSFGDVAHDGIFTFQMGGGAGPTERPVAGNPAGTLAVNGSLALDTNGKLWVKTGGAGVWSQLAIAGAGGPLFDTVNSQTVVGANFSTHDDVPLGGPLGTTTYIKMNQTGSSFTITGFDATSAVDGSVIFVQSVNGIAACPTAWLLSNEDPGSIATNRIISVGGAGAFSTAACQGGSWLRYDGAVSRWRVMEKV